MNKHKIFQVLAGLMFIASGMITIMLMLSNVTGTIPAILAIIQGVGIESAKTFFSYFFCITPANSQLGRKFIFGVLALIAFAISILATTGFSINMSSQVKNESLYESDEYKNKQKFLQVQSDLYEQTKKQIDDLRSKRDNHIAGMEKVRDNWGNSYKTMKSQEQERINSTMASYNEQINSKEVELKALSDSLKASTGELTEVKGYSALYVTLAKYINTAKSKVTTSTPTTGEDVSFWLNFCIAVSLEFFGIGFIYLAETQKNVGSLEGKESTREPLLKRDLNLVPKPALIGFRQQERQSPQEFSKNDVVEYVNFMYGNVKENNVSKGFKYIADNINVPVETGRKIRGHLEKLGVVATDGAKTVILCTKSEAMHKL